MQYQRCTVLSVFLLLSACLAASQTARADSVDVSVLVTIDSALHVDPVCGTCFVAQTFTPGQTGQLIGLALMIDVIGGPAQLSLHQAVGGIPTQTALASILLQPGTYGVNNFLSFPQPISITAGSQLAFVLTLTSGAEFYVYGFTSDQYAGGEAFLSFGWPTFIPYQVGEIPDFAFQTCMAGGNPTAACGAQGHLTPLPEPATISLIVMGMLFVFARSEAYKLQES